MKKRKNNNKKRSLPTPPPRFRRIRSSLYGLAFDLTTPSPDVYFGIELIGNPNSDRHQYVFRFNPPLEKIFAATTTITVTHLKSKRNDTTIVVLPKTEDKKLQDQFIRFVTHVVKMDEHIGSVRVLYLTLNNNQMKGDVDVPIWQPEFDLGLAFFKNRFTGRYNDLDFYEGGENGVTPFSPIDLSKIPQGSAVTGKPAGGITSSRVPTLLGCYPPGKTDFSGWMAVSIRFGKMNESTALAIYMNYYKNYNFQEIGFTSLETANTLDGAMFDGLMTDEETKVKHPVEFKCSRSNCNFEPAHIAQCIWEMACGYSYMDLVKYCERRTQLPDRKWNVTHECRRIRIYRCMETEQKIINLCKNSKEDLMDTPPYTEFREYLAKIATDANKDSSIVPVDLELIHDLREYKKNILNVQAEDVLSVHPIMDRIDKRQARIFASFQENDQEEFVGEVCEQIQDYSELMKINFI